MEARRTRRRPSPVALALVLLAYALALAQRPGEVIADTKVHLYVDPVRFLGDALSAWTPSGDLGHVWAGQYGGYVWPMAPWFAAGDVLGLPVWVVHRLWLGTLFAVAALGMVALLRALVDRKPGVLHLTAGALFVVNPYVAVYANRTSIALLAYAALPWLILCVHRGLRDPRGWRWPAIFALILTSTGGGVNAAVTAFVLLGPLLFVAYERVAGGVPAGAIRPWLVRMAAVNAVAQAWWVVPVLVHARYGLDFLPFTEQPGTIWQVTSLPESLRLMGFWTSYIGVGYDGVLRPFASHGPALLFQLGVVVASLVLPALALGAYALAGRARYAPWFLGLALLALLLMVAGFPEGTPLRRALTFTYNTVQPVQVLRTTYKAGPLLALSLAALGGMGLAVLWARWARARYAVALGVVGLAAVAAWPLTSGRAPERQLAFVVPDAWRAAAADLDRAGERTRALVLPGQLFGAYDWGQTIDAIGPTLTDHPIATRSIVPYADLRSVDVQWAVDDLVTQERALPGQMRPLLDLMGVGEVLLHTDGDRARAGQLGAAEAQRVLASQGLRGDAAAFGPVRREPAQPDRLTGGVRLPTVSRVRVPTGGLVRVVPRAAPVVAEGGAGALTGLAAFGALDPGRALAYAPDLDAGELATAARDGASLVIADGNRRQAFVSSRPRGNRGPVLRADQDVSQDGTMLDPFTTRDPATQTTSVLRGRGIAEVSAPASPQVTQFPEHRPTAALDGDLRTAWLGDRALDTGRHALTVRFTAPRDVDEIALTPYSDSRAEVLAVEVNGRRFAVRRGGNVLRVGLRGVSELRVRIAEVRRPRRASGGAGGIRELVIPGASVRELLRPPTGIERELARTGLPAEAGLTYLLSRTTADGPFDGARLSGESGAGELRNAQDPEDQLARLISPPARRSYAAEAWVRADPDAGDDALDRLAGVRGDLRVTSSSRFDGLPRHRGSGAFDGGSRAWIGQWLGRGTPAWLGWESPRPLALSTFRLVPPALQVRRPTRVRLTVDGRAGPPVRVGLDGSVVLPAAVSGRRFRLDVLAAAFGPGTPDRLRARRAVAIGEVSAPGLPRVAVPRAGSFSAPCSAAGVRTASSRIGFTVRGDLRALDAGRPLRARGCSTVDLLAGPVEVSGEDALLKVDHLRLTSPGEGAAPPAVGRVLSAGTSDRGKRTGARVEATAPALLVLGESYNPGWRATCDGRDLGAPLPRQGYANAWPIEAPGCRDAAFTWAPNATLRPAYVLSLLGCALLLLVALRRRRVLTCGHDPQEGTHRPAALPAAGPARVPLRKALAIGAAAGAVLGFVFALRAGVLLGPAVALVLHRGVPARLLVLAATGALAVVVPALYVLFPAKDRGGFSTTYATDHLGAHWVAVGAVCALGLALVSTARDRRGARAGARPVEAGPG